ncbi:hypothetical protein NDA16_003615 [Ustilago loliicola]|nr:hypothetical protein NDA16_003615 [Ustilago loliicola]
MVTSTKFDSLVGSVTLAFVLASSIHPVHTAPVVRRQDATANPAAAPAGYISVAQPSMTEQDIYAVGIPPPAPMTEQDIYAVGIPPAPAADTASQLDQVLKAAAQAALATSNTTTNVVNHYDASPSTELASPEQVSQVGTTEPVQMTGNPGEGDLFKKAAGVPAEQASDVYQNVIAQQMELLGNKARRGLEEMVTGMGRRQLGLGVPTPLSETGVASAAVSEVTGAAAAPVVSAASAPTDAVASAAAPAATAATAATASGMADVPVAAPVPSDFSSPPVGAPAVPSAPVADTPLPTTAPTDLPTSALPETPASLPSAALPSAAVPSAPAVSIPAVLPSLNAAAASATTLLPVSDASPAPVKTASPAEDVTMTVTLPTKALPTSIAGLPNVKANNAAANADGDGEGDWKTMTILVPAEAFGSNASAGGVKTQIPLPPVSSASASADSEVVSTTASPSSAKATPAEAPINLSSFTSMKAAATGVLTIPPTGIIDGTTYSTMLTLTIPRFGGPATSSAAPASTTSDADGDTEDCEEEDDQGAAGVVGPQSEPKSVLTKVWDWVTGKPLNERSWDDDYGYNYEDGQGEDGEWYDAQE